MVESSAPVLGSILVAAAVRFASVASDSCDLGLTIVIVKTVDWCDMGLRTCGQIDVKAVMPFTAK